MGEAGEGVGIRHQAGEDAGQQRASRHHVVAPAAPQEHADGSQKNDDDEQLFEVDEFSPA